MCFSTCVTEQSKLLSWTCANLAFPLKFREFGLMDGVLLSGKTSEDSRLVRVLIEIIGIFETVWNQVSFPCVAWIPLWVPTRYDGHVNKRKNKWFKLKHAETGSYWKCLWLVPVSRPASCAHSFEIFFIDASVWGHLADTNALQVGILHFTLTIKCTKI